MHVAERTMGLMISAMTIPISLSCNQTVFQISIVDRSSSRDGVNNTEIGRIQTV